MTIISLSTSLLLAVGLLAVSVLAGRFAPPLVLVIFTAFWIFGIVRTWLKYQGSRVITSVSFGIVLVAIMWGIHLLRSR